MDYDLSHDVGIIAGGIGMGLLYGAQRFGLLGKTEETGE